MSGTSLSHVVALPVRSQSWQVYCSTSKITTATHLHARQQMQQICVPGHDPPRIALVQPNTLMSALINCRVMCHTDSSHVRESSSQSDPEDTYDTSCCADWHNDFIPA
jgi:hypothetical protein